jgi:hypothetical protein
MQINIYSLALGTHIYREGESVERGKERKKERKSKTVLKL